MNTFVKCLVCELLFYLMDNVPSSLFLLRDVILNFDYDGIWSPNAVIVIFFLRRGSALLCFGLIVALQSSAVSEVMFCFEGSL